MYTQTYTEEGVSIQCHRFWPAEVRQRISATYGYFVSGLAVTAAAAYGAMRVEGVMRFLVTRPMMVITNKTQFICHVSCSP